MHSGLVFNVQRCSLHDGPGVRSTVFMKGCPLTCAWCHNPESRSPRQEFVRLRHRCMGCSRCTDEERAQDVVVGRGAADVRACPTGALQAVGELMEPEALLDTLLTDRIFFDESGGGVTFSGGEPLTQAAFVIDTLRLLQAEGVHTAVDTCGMVSTAALLDAASVTDLMLYDVKLMDEARHTAATGASNRQILKNLQALCQVHSNIWIRVPIIPGVNDDPDNLDATAAFLQPLSGIRQVTLLPYHSTGAAKFARHGLSYGLGETLPPDSSQLTTMADRFRAVGLTTTIGGHP